MKLILKEQKFMGKKPVRSGTFRQASLQKEAFNRTHKKMLTYHDLYAILMKQRKKSFFFALNSGNGFEAAQARN